LQLFPHFPKSFLRFSEIFSAFRRNLFRALPKSFFRFFAAQNPAFPPFSKKKTFVSVNDALRFAKATTYN